MPENSSESNDAEEVVDFVGNSPAAPESPPRRSSRFLVLVCAAIGGLGICLMLAVVLFTGYVFSTRVLPRLSPTPGRMSQSGSNDSLPPIPARQQPTERISALRRCRYLVVTHQYAPREFERALALNWEHFPVAQVAGPSQAAEWQEVTLNQGGQGFDAIRFTSSLPQSADLNWCFTTSGNLRRWEIGTLTGNSPHLGEPKYESLTWHRESHPSLGAGYPIYQTLDEGTIEPGKEYMIWFVFDSPEPVDVRFALGLRPSEPPNPNFTVTPTPESIAKGLGWSGPATHAGFTASPADELRPDERDHFDFQPRLPFTSRKFPISKLRDYQSVGN